MISGAAVIHVCEKHGRWLHDFLLLWGDDPDVADITAVLFHRWSLQLDQSRARDWSARATSHNVRALLDTAAEYIDFHGPHLWAGLLTEAGVRASLRGRRAADGSY